MDFAQQLAIQANMIADQPRRHHPSPALPHTRSPYTAVSPPSETMFDLPGHLQSSYFPPSSQPISSSTSSWKHVRPDMANVNSHAQYQQQQQQQHLHHHHHHPQHTGYQQQVMQHQQQSTPNQWNIPSHGHTQQRYGPSHPAPNQNQTWQHHADNAVSNHVENSKAQDYFQMNRFRPTLPYQGDTGWEINPANNKHMHSVGSMSVNYPTEPIRPTDVSNSGHGYHAKKISPENVSSDKIQGLQPGNVTQGPAALEPPPPLIPLSLCHNTSPSANHGLNKGQPHFPPQQTPANPVHALKDFCHNNMKAGHPATADGIMQAVLDAEKAAHPKSNEIPNDGNAKLMQCSNQTQFAQSTDYVFNFFSTVAQMTRFFNTFLQYGCSSLKTINIPFGDGIVVSINASSLSKMCPERYLLSQIAQLYGQIHPFLSLLFQSPKYARLAAQFRTWYVTEASKIKYSKGDSEEQTKIQRLSFVRLVLLELDTYRLNIIAESQCSNKATPQNVTTHQVNSSKYAEHALQNAKPSDPWYPMLYKQAKQGCDSEMVKHKSRDHNSQQMYDANTLIMQQPPKAPNPCHGEKLPYMQSMKQVPPPGHIDIHTIVRVPTQMDHSNDPGKMGNQDQQKNQPLQSSRVKRDGRTRWSRTKSDILSGNTSVPSGKVNNTEPATGVKRQRNESEPSDNNRCCPETKRMRTNKNPNVVTQIEEMSMPTVDSFLTIKDDKTMKCEPKENTFIEIKKEMDETYLPSSDKSFSPDPERLTIDENVLESASSDVVDSKVNIKKEKIFHPQPLDEAGEKQVQNLVDSLGLLPEAARVLVKTQREKRHLKRLQRESTDSETSKLGEKKILGCQLRNNGCTKVLMNSHTGSMEEVQEEAEDLRLLVSRQAAEDQPQDLRKHANQRDDEQQHTESHKLGKDALLLINPCVHPPQHISQELYTIESYNSVSPHD